MAKPEALYRIFRNLLNEASRKAILFEAQINDDRPPTMRGQAGNLDEAYTWMQRYRAKVAPLVLRYLDPPDELIEGLVADGDLRIPDSSDRAPETLSFSQLTGVETPDAKRHDQFPVFDLALTSAFMSEIFVDVAKAARVAGVMAEPPQTVITGGSLHYALGGGIFASGLGLLVACSAGLVGAPVTGPLAAATLATAGLFDLVLGWRKRVAETAKVYSEVRKLEADTRLVDLEVRIKELELEKAQFLGDRQRILFADSSDVPRQLVRSTAEDLKMDEGFANHLLNRCLTKYRVLKQMLSGATITRVKSGAFAGERDEIKRRKLPQGPTRGPSAPKRERFD